ncbi:MAG: ribosome recycling factor [Caldisericia bacterium]|nr:ribosome recycling factor [Caldisericia bacterium]
MREQEDLINEMKSRMQKSVYSFTEELSLIRAGKPNPAIISKIKVTTYGGNLFINQLANIYVSDSHTLIVEPWDKNTIKDIEKSIEKANLGIMPVNDGRNIRLPFPPLTEERRKDLIKLVQKIAEEARISIRNIRRDVNDKIKKLEKDKKISEDEMYRSEEEIQKLTDNFIKQIDEELKRKEQEIREI